MKLRVYDKYIDIKSHASWLDLIPYQVYIQYIPDITQRGELCLLQ